MELHRLDGLSGTGLDNIDIQDIAFETVEDDFNPSQVEALEALGYVREPDIMYEIQDDEGNIIMYADAEENLYMIDGLGELGFFKKIGKGLKNIGKFVSKKVVKPTVKAIGKGAKFVGKKVLKPAFRTFNRFLNPATILLRNGFLLAMKTNLFKVAERLRFGYLSDAEARKRGVNMREFSKLKKVVDKAGKIYDTAGGKKSNLKKAILSGKGNKDKAVPLSGFALGNPFEEDEGYNDAFEQFIVEADADIVEAFANDEIEIEGLGAVATGTAIAAASGAVGSIAALLGKITGVFDKAKQVKTQAENLIKPFQRPVQTNPVITSPIRPTVPFQQTLIPTNTSFPVRTSVPRSVSPAVTSRAVIPSVTTKPEEKESWLKRNKTPLLISAGVLVAGGGIYYAMKQRKKTAKPVNGISGTKTKRDELGRFVSSTPSRKRTSTKTKSKRKAPEKLVPTALL
ncbi:hypothetical protein J8281_03535 [Aquimarina sp. U1-2]|uniref:hypothetical protein n=1 Tax=Aquimarina sp. U1-2 TaxID=2823141 RepID=UPI001AEC8F67|nr:hypothetical protein [Aquimarina sp. U1-2]MBP2831250.1 hypothetical protein [Aquimarina sp. U1-2]